MVAKRVGAGSIRILAAAIVIALLGIALGGYLATSAKSSSTVTVAGSTTTATVVITSASVLTLSGGQQKPTVSTIVVGNATSSPEGMAFNPTNNEVYVALEASGSVAVINATTGALLTTIHLAAGDAPIALAYDPANNMVYVANVNGSCSPPKIATCSMLAINSTTNAVAATIPTPDTTNDVVVNPTTNIVYAPSNDDDAVFMVNGATNQLVGVLQNHTSIPDNSEALAVDSSRNAVFVGNWYDDRAVAQLGFMAAPTKSNCQFKANESYDCITRSLSIDGGKIDGVAVNQNTGMVYLANYGGDVVNVISETTGKDVANVTMPSPAGIAVDPYSNLVYVASNSTSTNSLFVISGSTNQVLGSVPVGHLGPANVVVDTNTNTIYVSNVDSGTVSVIDGTTLLF